jgi:hypothetical protein
VVVASGSSEVSASETPSFKARRRRAVFQRSV